MDIYKTIYRRNYKIMNNDTDKLFLKEVEKIAKRHNGTITYSNILTRQFWVDCPKGLEEIISLEIESLLAEFRINHCNFEEEKETTIDGWPINIGSIVK